LYIEEEEEEEEITLNDSLVIDDAEEANILQAITVLNTE